VQGGIALWKAYELMNEDRKEPPPAERALAEAFTRTILEQPDEDTPRLVFADWLEEKGEGARAEFIRVQCEVERLTGDKPRRARLLDRAKDLLGVYKARWAGAVHTQAARYRFRRGFVYEVEITPPLAPRLEGLCRQQPVQSVWLLQVNDDELIRVAAVASLARIRSLAIGTDSRIRSAEALAAIATSPYARGLTSLSLRECFIGPEGVRALAGGPSLSQLKSLTLSHNQIYGVTPECDETVLFSKGIGDVGAEALASSTHLEQLEILRLRGCGIGDAGAHALACGVCPY
jgi:uncharacterized protein (TIGR02996 family)